MLSGIWKAGDRGCREGFAGYLFFDVDILEIFMWFGYNIFVEKRCILEMWMS